MTAPSYRYDELRDAFRWRVALILAALMLLLMFTLGISNARMGFDDTSRLAWIVFSCTLVSLVVLWRLPKRAGSMLFFAMVAALLLFAVLFGLWHQRPLHYWAYLFPPVIVFLLRARQAAIAMLSFGLLTGGIASTLTSSIEVIRFASVYGLMICFVTTYALLEERAAALLRWQSERDGLTGCLNRRAFNERMAALARDDAEGVAVVLLDLDHFKDINDTHGHLVGDAVLRETASRLTHGLRSENQLYRYGGEEFAVVVPGLGRTEAHAMAERLRRSVADTAFNAPAPNVRLSAGVALWQPSKEAPETALQRADAALYAAKAEGRDRVVMAESAAG